MAIVPNCGIVVACHQARMRRLREQREEEQKKQKELINKKEKECE